LLGYDCLKGMAGLIFFQAVWFKLKSNIGKIGQFHAALSKSSAYRL
jgi:hypothetical protein